MIEAAERDGKLKPGATIVEPTSGNTGIGLAMVAAVKGYKLIVTMPEDMSLARRDILARYGAQVVLTPAIEGMTGSVYAAQEMLEKNPDYFMCQQFENPNNPDIHRKTTALEILDATDGQDRRIRRRRGHGRHDHRRRRGAAREARQGRADRRRRADALSGARRADAPACTRSRASARASCRAS